jgi:hypothetical protein
MVLRQFSPFYIIIYFDKIRFNIISKVLYVPAFQEVSVSYGDLFVSCLSLDVHITSLPTPFDYHNRLNGLLGTEQAYTPEATSRPANQEIPTLI